MNKNFIMLGMLGISSIILLVLVDNNKISTFPTMLSGNKQQINHRSTFSKEEKIKYIDTFQTKRSKTENKQIHAINDRYKIEYRGRGERIRTQIRIGDEILDTSLPIAQCTNKNNCPIYIYDKNKNKKYIVDGYIIRKINRSGLKKNKILKVYFDKEGKLLSVKVEDMLKKYKQVSTNGDLPSFSFFK